MEPAPPPTDRELLERVLELLEEAPLWRGTYTEGHPPPLEGPLAVGNVSQAPLPYMTRDASWVPLIECVPSSSWAFRWRFRAPDGYASRWFGPVELYAWERLPAPRRAP